MKTIKINAANYDAISNALYLANGKATAHTFTTAASIIAIAKRADADLYKLLANKKLMKGATLTARSGDSLPNCYRHSRICTRIVIECFGAGDWRLVDVEAITAGNDAGKEVLSLTEAQDERAISLLRSSYLIKQAA